MCVYEGCSEGRSGCWFWGLVFVFGGRPGNLVTTSFTGLNRHFNFCAVVTVLMLFLRTGFKLSKGRTNLVCSAFCFSVCVLTLVNNVVTSEAHGCGNAVFANVILVTMNCLVLTVPSPAPIIGGALFLIVAYTTLFIVTFKGNLFGKGLRTLMKRVCSGPRCSDVHSSNFSLFCVFVGMNTVFTPFTTMNMHG